MEMSFYQNRIIGSIFLILLISGIIRSEPPENDLLIRNYFTGQRTEPLSQFYYIEWEFASEIQWLEGVDWGGAAFDGGADYGINLFGSSIPPESAIDVEIRFSSSDSSQAYTFRRDLDYAPAGLGNFPGSAWDISDPDNPRRLNICFVENDDSTKAANHYWDPDTSAVGGREYLFILNSDYNPNPSHPIYTQEDILFDTENFDCNYILWSKINPLNFLLQTEAVLTFYNKSITFNNVTIQQVQEVDDPALNDSSGLFGDTVRVTGLVMTGPRDVWLGGSRWGCFIIDPDNYPAPWSGLFIIQDDTTVSGTGFANVRPGSTYEFTGVVIEYNHFTEISLLTDPVVPVNNIYRDIPLPEPLKITSEQLQERSVAEQWESMWIGIDTAQIVQNDLPDNLASFTQPGGGIAYLGEDFKWFKNLFDTGGYQWPVPLSRVNIKGFVRDKSLGIGQLYSVNPRNDSDLEILPEVPEVIVTAPNGGEVWNQAWRNAIEWQTRGIPEVDNIEILYSTDNGQTFTQIIDSTDNDGYYSWFVPDIASEQVKIKVVAYFAISTTYEDQSNTAFNIVEVDRYVHNTGTLSHTVRNDGITGNSGRMSGLNLDETAMEFPPESGNHHLYMQQLIFGATTPDGDTVGTIPYSDNFIPISTLTSSTQNNDIGEYIRTETRYKDKYNLGIEVTQKSYALTNKPFIILEYQIQNKSGRSFPEFYIGSYADFDINIWNQNLVSYNADEQLAYLSDANGDWSSLGGMRYLMDGMYCFHRMTIEPKITTATGIFNIMSTPGFDDVSDGLIAEFRLLQGASLLNFLPESEITMAIALLAEDGETALFTAGDEARLFWDNLYDAEVPSISNISESSAEINQPLTISAKIMDNTIVNTVTLKYRKGGDNSFNSLTMNPTGLNDLYEAIIPGSDVTVRSVEFYILARDAAGNQHSSEHKMTQILVPAGNLSMPVYDGGGEQNAYRMISIPLFLENPQNLFAPLMPYDDTKWRASHDNGTIFTEYTDGIGDLEPGRAFWFISINDVNWSPGSGSTQGLFSFASINLHPGWNQIGNPLNYSVSWQDIMNQNGSPNISGPYLYEGSYDIKTTIEPFKGYYVNNQTGANFNLEIPLNGAGAAVAKPVGANNGWQVSIVASIDQAEDRLNIIGIEEDAKEDWDRGDYPEPPPIGKYISLYFPHYEWKEHPGRYAVDIRKNSDKGLIWNFEVETNIRQGQIHLSFKELQEIANSGKIPVDFQIILIDQQLKIAKNLREECEYNFIAGTKDQTKKLSLLIGTPLFISQNSADIQVIPVSYQLYQNFPNPFNPNTQIMFSLPANQHVDLVIYNILGEKIYTLISDQPYPAGYHVVMWNGKNQLRHSVASGVYIYELRTGSIVLRKKMILLR